MHARGVLVQYRMQGIRTSTLKEYVLQRLSGQHTSQTMDALKDASLDVRRGECVALIGHNGCGKSTFLKVIAEILKPKSGDVEVYGRVAPLIELGAGFDPELTGRENVYLSCSLMGLSRREIDGRIGSIEAFADLGAYFGQPVKTYSSGMYMRLGFSCAMAIDAELLLIDEILAVGDENFQRKCFAKLTEVRKAGVSIVLVTHDLNVVRAIADRALVLDHGRVVYEGRPRPAVQYYLDLMELARIEVLKPEHRTEAQEQRLQKKHEVVPRDPETLGDAKNRAVRVVGSEGIEGKVLAGETWTLEVDVEVMHPFPEAPVVGFAIQRPDGLRIFGGNTHERCAQDPVLANKLRHRGRHTVRFVFDRAILAANQYNVIAAIHSHGLSQTIEIAEFKDALSVVDRGDEWNNDNDVIAFQERLSRVDVRDTP